MCNRPELRDKVFEKFYLDHMQVTAVPCLMKSLRLLLSCFGTPSRRCS